MRASPFLTGDASISSIMSRVCLALVPGIAVYTWFVGPILLVQLAIATVAALGFEALVLKMRQKPVLLHLEDGSALVTAWLIGLTFPPITPWWLTVTGVFFAIVIAKHLYGGLGQNPFNPAMIAFAVCIVAFPALMSQWPAHGLTYGFKEQFFVVFGMTPRLDALTGATPLDALKTLARMDDAAFGQYGSLKAFLSSQELYGNFAGRGWEWVTAAWLVGGIALIIQRVITWHVPIAFLLGMALISGLCWGIDPVHYADPVFQLFSGGAMLGAFFIATDPVTGCVSTRGKLIFGFFAGILAYVIRIFGAFPDGIAFSILIMNIAAPLIDQLTRPAVFGKRRNKRRESNPR
ncbi:MAG: RnfABCDGE type electron transport complex subunit D [Zoogloeaceae bacterium]|jgi:electron transport complex protein RnfD|nr:RnfABCDGE type electron transport complex subunit D [Zoogloeaceae bacterium]